MSFLTNNTFSNAKNEEYNTFSNAMNEEYNTFSNAI
jgi:hypothetical protein